MQELIMQEMQQKLKSPAIDVRRTSTYIFQLQSIWLSLLIGIDT